MLHAVGTIATKSMNEKMRGCDVLKKATKTIQMVTAVVNSVLHDWINYYDKFYQTKRRKFIKIDLPFWFARVKVMDKIKDAFKHYKSRPLNRVRDLVDPILNGWVQYFKIDDSSKVFGHIKLVNQEDSEALNGGHRKAGLRVDAMEYEGTLRHV